GDARANPVRALAYYGGVLLVFLALASPLDAGAERLLSLHMLQHVLLASVAPPLLLLGLPPTLLADLLQPQVLRAVVGFMTKPLVAAAVFSVNMWLWHVPAAYDLALDHLGVHIVQHILFIGTGLAFWWPVIAPLPGLGGLPVGGKMLYLFVSGFPMGV